MIKTFEQFVSTVYGRPINEAFKSNKLRQIIKQHGKPKYSWENKILYDLKDEEIIDVVDEDEYYDKYFNKHKRGGKETIFTITLEDGYSIVISNLDIPYIATDYNEEKDKIFKKRHAERHKGNLGKGGDTIHKKHMEKVKEIGSKRLVKKLQEFIPEIVETLQSALENNVNISDIGPNKHTSYDDYDIENISLDGDDYAINVYIDIVTSYTTYHNGEYYYTGEYTLEKFEIVSYEEGYTVSNIDLGITHDKYDNLFQTYEVELEV
jgi:hypothetical protein